jgi:hypothetical protein
MMISFEAAKAIAEEYVKNKKYAFRGDELMLADVTIEKPYGWVFSYTSKKFYLEIAQP